MIAIIDYELGNLNSVQRAFQYLGVESIITSNPQDLIQSKYLVLPGVGAFGEGMAHLKDKGLDETICQLGHEGKPILGICLGMQLLFSQSQELGNFQGLDLVQGDVLIL